MNKFVLMKNGIEMGWFKNLEGGVNCILMTCKYHGRELGFDPRSYQIVDAVTREILWSGEKEYPNGL